MFATLKREGNVILSPIFVVLSSSACPEQNTLCGLKYGGESGIVFRPISEITATMEKSFYPFVIADTFRVAAMKLDDG